MNQSSSKLSAWRLSIPCSDGCWILSYVKTCSKIEAVFLVSTFLVLFCFLRSRRFILNCFHRIMWWMNNALSERENLSYFCAVIENNILHPSVRRSFELCTVFYPKEWMQKRETSLRHVVSARSFSSAAGDITARWFENEAPGKKITCACTEWWFLCCTSSLHHRVDHVMSRTACTRICALHQPWGLLHFWLCDHTRHLRSIISFSISNFVTTQDIFALFQSFLIHR